MKDLLKHFKDKGIQEEMKRGLTFRFNSDTILAPWMKDLLKRLWTKGIQRGMKRDLTIRKIF